MINLKVGDRIKGIDDSRLFTGTVYDITGFNRGTIKRDDGRSGSGCFIKEHDYYGWAFNNLENYKLELIGSSEFKTIMATIKEKFTTMFLAEPEKSFRKAGITNGDGYLTDDGQKIFLIWLLKKNGDTFKTEVVDQLIKYSEEK